MIQFIRFFLWGTVVSLLNSTFVLVPLKDPRLLDLFNKNMAIIETSCGLTKGTTAPVFTSLVVKRIPDAIAYCQRKANGFIIAFDELYLNRILTDLQKDQVMMHELAHCIFKEKHYSDRSHFMAEYFEDIPKEIYEKQVQQYLNDKCNKNATSNNN